MANECIYKMRIDDKEFTGTAAELAKVSGYSRRVIGMIERGDVNARKGVSVEKISVNESKEKSNWRNDVQVLEAWDKAVERFKNVEWVGKDSGEGRKLDLIRGNGYRTFSS